jgi:hypothetical protein
MFPTAGPTIIKMAITAIAIKRRINAYSTSPCPSSPGKKIMGYHLLPPTLPVREPRVHPSIHH